MNHKLPILIFTISLILLAGSFEQVLASHYSRSVSCFEDFRLKELPKYFSGGLIMGKIDESIKDFSGKDLRSKPMPNVQVKAQQIGNWQSAFFGMTNEKGVYEIEVPVGKYVVSLIDTNVYYGVPSDNEPIELSDKECKTKDFYVINDSRIIGKAIDSEGNPVTNVTVDLISIEGDRKKEKFDYSTSHTDDNGIFVFPGMSSGKYQISLNYAEKPDAFSPYPTYFYPNTPNRNDAQIIEIKYGTKIKDLVFQLPPKLAKRKIVGQVFWENGKPAKNAEVQLNDVNFDEDVYLGEIKTNDKGEFEIEWFEGRNYKIVVRVLEKAENGNFSFVIASAESETFVLDKNSSNIKLTLRELSEKDKLYFRKIGRSN